MEAIAIALWMIALCEVIRMIQNAWQINYMQKEKPYRENAYKEFVKSLNQTDTEFVEQMLEEFKTGREENG